jgi:hypothetical protein
MTGVFMVRSGPQFFGSNLHLNQWFVDDSSFRRSPGLRAYLNERRVGRKVRHLDKGKTGVGISERGMNLAVRMLRPMHGRSRRIAATQTKGLRHVRRSNMERADRYLFGPCVRFGTL